MPAKPKMLLVSTINDPSLMLFENEEASKLIEPYFINYDASDGSINDTLKHNYSYVYFRDPFNDPGISQVAVQRNIETISSKLSAAYFVDHVSSYKQALFEDKWLQYKSLSKYMPKTRILESKDEIDYVKYFIKKRISSRAKGIIFSKEGFSISAIASDYIVQPKLRIRVEYRVFMVGGQVTLPIAIKSSRTVDQRVKVIDIESNVDPELLSLCNYVYTTTNYDLMGLDIVKTDDGYYLLEVNRSCQFRGYKIKSSVNLALQLNKILLTRLVLKN
jgi:hypothetical protein